MLTRPSGRTGGCAFRVNPSVPPPIRRLRLGRAFLEAVCVVSGFAGFTALILVLS